MHAERTCSSVRNTLGTRWGLPLDLVGSNTRLVGSGSTFNLGLFLVGFDGIHTRSGAIWWDLVGSTVYLVLSSGILTQSGAIW